VFPIYTSLTRVSHLKNNAQHASMNAHHAIGPNINIRCARAARSTHSKFLPLARFRSSTPPMPRACCHLWSAPSTPLDRFALSLNRFTRSTSPPLAPEHAIDLNRFAGARRRLRPRSTPSTSTSSPGARRRPRPLRRCPRR
jgi:hypothetical protein